MLDTKLITFLTLIEEKNYTNTAKRLKFTQPAITHHIKQLEAELQITLFDDPKTFELSKQGKVLLEYVKAAKEDYELLQNTVRKPDTRVMNIAFTDPAFHCIKNNEMRSIYANSGFIMNLLVQNSDEINEGLSNGTIDFAFVDNSFDSKKFNFHVIMSSKLVIMCKKDGQFANRERITREQLLNACVVMFPEGNGMNRLVTSALLNKNLKLRPSNIIYANGIEQMKSLVELYDGIAFVYEDAVKYSFSDDIFKRIELLNFAPKQNIYLIYNRAMALDDVMVEVIKKFDEVGEKYA